VSPVILAISPGTGEPLWPYVLGGAASIAAAVTGGIALMRGYRKDAVQQAAQDLAVAQTIRDIQAGLATAQTRLDELRRQDSDHATSAAAIVARFEEQIYELQRHTGLRNGRPRRSPDGH
jgi:hypothetical protein